MRPLLAILALMLSLTAQAAPARHAVAMFGEPALPPDFAHLQYVNPDAPKGGALRRHTLGSFDSLNPFVPKGTAAIGLGQIYDTLTEQNLDEPFSQYGLLAESIEMPEDRSWVIYRLRPQARFSDGRPVTAEDVVFSFRLLTEQGSPLYAFYYHDVEKVEALDPHTVRFSFAEGDNRELALIVGQLQILPRHYWQDRDFGRATLEIPVGSGPYRIRSVDPGKRIVYERRDDYWGKDLPINRGRHNFDRITVEYYLDDSVALEAFKAGRYDLRVESSASNWARAYQGPALQRGDIRQESFRHRLPAGMQGFVYNLRRPVFQDPVLREALSYAMDFEWANQTLFHGQYKRTRSYFQNSELAATGLPSAAELALLEPLREQLPARVFTHEYRPPVSDGSGRPRDNLMKAKTLLEQAGYVVRDNRLLNPAGRPVTFEILLDSVLFERIAQPFIRNLQLLGVHATLRRVDSAQYVERVRHFDYDMVVQVIPQSNSPGNEQRDFFHSSSATRPDSQNYIGLQDPAVDRLVEQVIRARDREQLVTATRALDRALQWGFYVIPNWHLDAFRIATWKHLAHPPVMPRYGMPLDTWWDRRAEPVAP